jgi:hypothetical protein
VATDRRGLIQRAEHKSAVTSLLQLAKLDTAFEIDDFIAYYNENKAFTPKQLALLIWRMSHFRIAYNQRHFRMKIRRNREKGQLRQMDATKLQAIWPCMTDTQRRWYVGHVQAGPG